MAPPAQDDFDEDLKASSKDVGQLNEVIEDQFGIASGNTRIRAVPGWRRRKIKVADYYAHLKIVVASNLHREKSPEWWTEQLNEAGKWLVENEKVKPGEISKRLVKDFGLSRRTILRRLGQEFKEKQKVEAGKKGGGRKKVIITPYEQIREEEPVFEPPSVETASSNNLVYLPEARTTGYIRPPDEEATADIVDAFLREGFVVKSSEAVPINRLKCSRCNAEYKAKEGEDDEARRCSKCKIRNTLKQMAFTVDIMVDGNEGRRYAVQPGEGWKDIFKTLEERDSYLREKGIEPYHDAGEIIRNHGLYLIVDNIRLREKLLTTKEHTLAVAASRVSAFYYDYNRVEGEIVVIEGPTVLTIKKMD